MNKLNLRTLGSLGTIAIIAAILLILSRSEHPKLPTQPTSSATPIPSLSMVKPALSQAASTTPSIDPTTLRPSSTLAPTITHIPLDTRTPAPTPTVTPKQQITPTWNFSCQKANPVVTAASIDTIVLSPSGQWVSYWLSTAEDYARMQGYRPPAAYYFYNLKTGQSCARPELTRLDEYPPLEGIAPQIYGPVQWSSDETGVIVSTEQGFYQGKPCQPQPFTQVPNDVVPDKTGSNANDPIDPSLSPDGKYQIHETDGPLLDDQATATVTATITSTLDGHVVVQVRFQVFSAIGGYGMNGEWLTNQRYLISDSADQGPLILDVDQGVIPVATSIFKLETDQPGEYGRLLTYASTNFIAQNYHIILVANGEYEKLAPIQLYHSENGSVESLPYPNFWRFSQDGEWLIMDAEPIINGYTSTALWIRRVDRPEDAWQQIGSDMDYIYWNMDWSQLVYGHTNSYQLNWQTFPEGKNLGCWSTNPYKAIPETFSIDGCTLLAWGTRPGERDDGLFIINRCLPTPTPPPLLTQSQQFSTVTEAQTASGFTILSPSFVPEGLPLDKVTVMDYADGSQTVQITYAEDFTGERPDANQKLIFIRMTTGEAPVTLDSLKSLFKEVAWDIKPVTVRGQDGFTYWEPSGAAGNSAWLSWNERGLTISIAFYGNWPQPTETNPHGLDTLLIQIAESLGVD